MTSTTSAAMALDGAIPPQNATIPMSDTTAPATAIGRHHSWVSRRPDAAADEQDGRRRPDDRPGRVGDAIAEGRAEEPGAAGLVGPAGEAEGGGEEQDVADAVEDEDDGEADAQDVG